MSGVSGINMVQQVFQKEGYLRLFVGKTSVNGAESGCSLGEWEMPIQVHVITLHKKQSYMLSYLLSNIIINLNASIVRKPHHWFIETQGTFNYLKCFHLLIFFGSTHRQIERFSHF